MAQEFESVDPQKINDILARVYSDYRGDDVERMAIFTDDNQMLVLGSRERNRVSISLADIIKQLARRGKTLGNVTRMVHNHNRGENIAPQDMEIYKKLKSVGFNGAYQVYDPERRRLKTATLKEGK